MYSPMHEELTRLSMFSTRQFGEKTSLVAPCGTTWLTLAKKFLDGARRVLDELRPTIVLT